MIIAMIIFIIILSWIKDDHITTQPQQQITIKKSTTYAFTQFIASYKRTFSHGWVFIQRCKEFPLIPLSVALFEGIFFGSLWFIIPLYLAKHTEYISY
jgi:hypothetical protein